MRLDKEFNSVLVRRGFIWGPSPEIYSGVSGFYDFGPLGKLLKNKVEGIIRRSFMNAGFWEIESPILMPRVVWEASGHVERFVDPILQCKKCNSIFRADTLLKEKFPKKDFSGMDIIELNKEVKKHKLKCPKCGGEFKDVFEYNLMLKSTVGIDQEFFLRPETATTTYLLFPRYYEFFRKKLPISVFQIGKAFRNEISPRQGMLRLREFTQAEGQIFVTKEFFNNFNRYEDIKDKEIIIYPWELQKSNKKPIKIRLSEALKKKYFKKKIYAYAVHLAYSIFRNMGFPESKIRVRQHSPKEMAHYAKDAYDVEIYSKNYGWFEVCGVHDRGNYDLSRHQKYSKKNLSINGEVPSIIEIAFGIERPLYMLLETFYVKDEIRTWFNFPPKISPIEVAVFPLVNKDNLPDKALQIFNELNNEGFVVIYDKSGSIGRRYRRMDEVGTPFCITVDYQTLEDDTVTLRYRDTMKQERVNIMDLKEKLNDLLK